MLLLKLTVPVHSFTIVLKLHLTSATERGRAIQAVVDVNKGNLCSGW